MSPIEIGGRNVEILEVPIVGCCSYSLLPSLRMSFLEHGVEE